MRKTNNKQYKFFCLFLFFVNIFVVISCTFNAQERDFKKGQEDLKNKNYESAIENFEKVIKRERDSDYAIAAAQKGSEISLFNLKQFSKTIKFLKHIVFYSKDPKLRIKSQKKIAEVLYNNLSDYENAIIEFNRLLDLPHSRSEEIDYRMYLSRSYFYINKFFQTHVELEFIEKLNPGEDILFDAKLLKGNIYMATKDTEKAINVYQEILKQFPVRSRNEQVMMNLSLCYEEINSFDQAINVLEKLKSTYSPKEFIELRIKKLKMRKSLMPGARGLRK